MIFFVKLFLAHLIGDFLLQPESFVKAKEEGKLNAWQLWAHAGIHGLLVFLFVYSSEPALASLLIAGSVATAHLFIDAAKLYLQTEKTRRICFLIDQIAHFTSLILITIWLANGSLPFNLLANPELLYLVTAIVFLTQPSSIAIKVFISKWAPQIGEGQDDSIQSADDLESLASAGKYIGMLERLFVFVFIVTDHWQAIGFLIAAKSIFRFGYLREAKNRKLTEYFLIGTLTSFGLAIIAGLIYLKLASTAP